LAIESCETFCFCVLLQLVNIIKGREIYERIVNKGKSKKLALIAVSNKLIKPSFAIAKSGNPYDEKYVSVLPK
jgi:hypothetical protein